MQRYELAGRRRALRRVGQVAGQRPVRVVADRGFAAVALLDLGQELGGAFSMRGKRSTLVCLDGIWRSLSLWRFACNSRHRSFGHLFYCRQNPHAGWLP
jgi:hypothetical protein